MDNSISKMRPELVSEWSSRNLPLTPDEVPFGSNKMYWWTGPCGHEWQTSAKARSAGEKCPICANARIVAGINDLATLHPELASEWSPKIYPLEPTMVGSGTHRKVIWHGKCGHEWSASVKSRVAGTGCPYCSHNTVLAGFNDLETLFPKVAKEWSPRNLPLLPSQVTAFANKKVWWRCSEGHEWFTLISTRSDGSACPYCSGIKTLKGFNDFATTHPDMAREWAERNGDLKPDMVNAKSTLNVWWTCSTCGYEWRSVIKARVKGTVCPVCADRSVLKGYNDLKTTDTELLSEWDYEKNILAPTGVSRNSMKPVWWKCSYGHSWKEKISNRTIGRTGCKTCEEEFLRILPQLLILLYCGRHGVDVKLNDETTIGILLDAYIPESRLGFVVIDRGTKTEHKKLLVAKHLCKARTIKCVCLSLRNGPENICVEIKKAFRSMHIYITSKIENDIQTARKRFEELRKNH